MVDLLDPALNADELESIEDHGYSASDLEVKIVVQRDLWCTTCKSSLTGWGRGCGGMHPSCPHGIEIGF